MKREMKPSVHIRTRYAIVKRAEKILKEVDDYFEDAADFGLSVEEADPRGELVAIRKGIIAMLENETRLKTQNEEVPVRD